MWGLLHEVVAFSWKVGWSWNVQHILAPALLPTSGTWWLDKGETLSLMWGLDPQSEKVEAANPVKTEDWQSYDITSAVLIGERNQVTRAAQIEGEGKGLHLLRRGDACACRSRRNC